MLENESMPGTMQVKKDSREPCEMQISLKINSYVFLFGLPLLLTVIILGTVGVSYVVTKPNVMMPNLTVQSPKVEATVNVPGQPAPVVQAPDIVVNVPPSRPNIMVSQSPAAPPQVNVTVPDAKPGEVRTIEKIVEKTNPVPVPIYIETADKDKAVVTIHDVYRAAEKYIEDYCQVSGKDPAKESERWLSVWNSRIKENGDEQRLANDVLIQKRGGFDVAQAEPAEVVEVCRLMLRYRDAKLSIPSVFKEVLTADNLYKFKTALDQGIKLSKPADVSTKK